MKYILTSSYLNHKISLATPTSVMEMAVLYLHFDSVENIRFWLLKSDIFHHVSLWLARSPLIFRLH